MVTNPQATSLAQFSVAVPKALVSLFPRASVFRLSLTTAPNSYGSRQGPLWCYDFLGAQKTIPWALLTGGEERRGSSVSLPCRRWGVSPKCRGRQRPGPGAACRAGASGVQETCSQGGRKLFRASHMCPWVINRG